MSLSLSPRQPALACAHSQRYLGGGAVPLSLSHCHAPKKATRSGMTPSPPCPAPSLTPFYCNFRTCSTLMALKLPVLPPKKTTTVETHHCSPRRPTSPRPLAFPLLTSSPTWPPPFTPLFSPIGPTNRPSSCWYRASWSTRRPYSATLLSRALLVLGFRRGPAAQDGACGRPFCSLFVRVTFTYPVLCTDCLCFFVPFHFVQFLDRLHVAYSALCSA